MPRGDKSKYTDKQERKADHIAEGYEHKGVGEKEAERRAWATVNKDDGGGKKPGGGVMYFHLAPEGCFAATAASDGAALAAFAFGLINEGNACTNDSRACDSTTRSCGRFGPARLDSTVARSRLSSSEYSASGVLAS